MMNKNPAEKIITEAAKDFRSNSELIHTILNSFSIPQNFGFFDDDLSGVSPLLYQKALESNYLYKNFKEYLYEKISPIANIQIFKGISKLAIVLEDYDFVIKIPFNGYPDIIRDESYPINWYSLSKEEREDWTKKHQHLNFIDFQYADIEDDPTDYCLLELHKYEQIVIDGFSEYFAETAFFDFKDGHRIYVQEKVIPDEQNYWNEENLPEEISDEVQTLTDSLQVTSYLPEDWWAAALTKHSFDEVIQFASYLEKDPHDLRLIDDVHSGNIGRKEDGHPCFLDFSGYYE